MRKPMSGLVALLALVLVAGGCASSDGDAAATSDLSIAVTTNILGDVVTELIGEQAEVLTLMPVGADPHDFQASAQEVDQLLSADLVIANGAGFEEGLTDVIESARAEGVPVIEAIDFVTTIEFGSDDHGDHEDEHGDHEDEHGDEGDEHGDEGDEHGDEGDEHGDEGDEHGDHEDEHGDEGDEHGDHDHEGVDPHFFTDTARMIDAVNGLSTALAQVEGVDTDALQVATDAYLAQLEAVDADVRELLEGIPAERRVLVTNHEVFGYVADRFEFEIVGVVVPGGGTGDSVSAGDLAELASDIEAEGVPAIFVDTSAATSLAETLAAEVGDVDVVALYSESLGDTDSDGATYLEMVRTNAERISSALG